METILYNYRNSRMLNILLFIAVILLMIYGCHQHNLAVKNQVASDIVEKYIQPDTTISEAAERVLDTSVVRPNEAVVPPLKDDPVFRTIKEFFDSADKSSPQIADRPVEQPIKPIIIDYADTVRFVKTIDSLQDVIKFKDIVFQNPYLTFDPAKKNADSSKSAAPYSYKAQIDANPKFVTGKVLGMKLGLTKSFITLTSRDSNAIINGNKIYEYGLANPNYGLRLQGVWAYNFVTKAWTLGPGLRMDIGRFSINLSSPYNFSRKEFTQSVSVTGDIIRF